MVTVYRRRKRLDGNQPLDKPSTSSYTRDTMTRPTTTEKLTGRTKRVGLWCVPGHDYTLQANAIFPVEALV